LYTEARGCCTRAMQTCDIWNQAIQPLTCRGPQYSISKYSISE
jgi:hypothetical protein